MNKSQSKLFDNYPEIISVEQLMQMLNIGKVLAYKLISTKQVSAVKIGREYKITKDSVIAILSGGIKQCEEA